LFIFLNISIYKDIKYKNSQIYSLFSVKQAFLSNIYCQVSNKKMQLVISGHEKKRSLGFIFPILCLGLQKQGFGKIPFFICRNYSNLVKLPMFST